MKKYIDLEDMVNLNCSKVLDIIQKNKEISRKEITDISGLSWGGMTKIVNRLLENEYIVEKKSGHKTDEQKQSGGRTPSVLSVNTEKNFVIGLDVNKIGLNAIVMNLAGETLKSFSAPVTAESADGFLSEIIDFSKSICESFEDKTIVSAGVAMQGRVDSKNGISLEIPGIADWINVEIKNVLETELGIQTFVEHDPDCLLYPHIQNNKKENTVLLRIDKSVGMAAAIGGKIIKGNGIFEVAHTIIIPGGKKCGCGLCGCLEAYVGSCITKDGIDETAVSELILPLAIAVKNLSELFGADRIILTGSLMEYSDYFARKLLGTLDDLRVDLAVEFYSLSDYAVKGAALIAVNKTINSLLM